MYEQAYDEKTTDSLSRWPGQWLRIVYGVWADQAWYWQNVRPRLHGRQRGWGIFVQAILGSFLAALSITLVLCGILLIGGAHLNWSGISVGIIYGGAFGLLLSASLAISRAFGLACGVPMGTTLVASISVVMSVFGALFYDTAEKVHTMLLMAPSALIGVVVGVALGIAFAVINGTGIVTPLLVRRGVIIFTLVLLTVMAVVLVVFVSRRSGQFSASIFWGVYVGWMLGIYTGERWAIRQIADKETRKRLANPNQETTLFPSF